MLTKRERVMRTVRFQETDRVPVYDLIQNDAMIEHYAADLLKGQRLTVENGMRVKGFAIGRTLDMTRAPEGPAEPCDRQDYNGLVIHQEPWTSWIVSRPYHDTPGLVAWVKQEIKRSQEQAFDQSYRQWFDDWLHQCAGYFAAGDPTGRSDPTVQVVESGVGLTEMYWLVGMDNFTTLIFDYPELVEEWLEARNQAELRRVAAIAGPGRLPIVLTYDDIAFKHATLFSPKWLRRYFFPRLKRLVDAWHSRDTICLFHSDGNLWAVMDDLVGAGIDGLNPLEVLAGMNVKAVREKYPSLFLTGGIDVSQLMCFGTPDEVRAVCRQAIADAGGVGYFLGSTTELHWGVTRENITAMLETAWQG